MGRIAAATRCFWHAADVFGISKQPICVMCPLAGQSAPKLGFRSCSSSWPACHNHTNPAAWTHYWMKLPSLRDVAADTVREEQRPYCTLDLEGVFTEDVAQILARPRSKHFRMVEVGTTFGDCTLLARAMTVRSGMQFRAVVFEANPEAV